MKLRPGYRIYGLAAIAFGVITIVWQQISALANLSHPVILVYIAALMEIIGGMAIQWQRTMKVGAVTLAVLFLIFTLRLVPSIFEAPLAYFNWGNFFEELSIAIGAIFVFTSTLSDQERTAKLTRIIYLCYGLCVVSYSLYQFFYLQYTANLVPTWLPPGQMFWAVATSIAFALAAFSILSGHRALLATRLLMAMFIGFCLLVWMPLCLNAPHNMQYWYSNTQTLAAAGSAGIVADFLFQTKIIFPVWPFGRSHIEQNKV